MTPARSNKATAATKAAKPAAVKHTISTNDEHAQTLAARRGLAQAAAQSALENGVGAKAALKMEEFKVQGLPSKRARRFYPKR